MVTRFGKFVRKRRVELDMRIQDVADKLGVSTAYISAVECGKSNPNQGYLKALGQVLELDATQQKMMEEEACYSKNKFILKPKTDSEKLVVSLFEKALLDGSMTDEKCRKILEVLKDGD